MDGDRIWVSCWIQALARILWSTALSWGQKSFYLPPEGGTRNRVKLTSGGNRAADLFARGFARVQHRNAGIDFRVRARDDVRTHDFADSATGRRAGVNCRFNRAHLTADNRSHQSGVNLLPADQRHVGSFHGRVGSFNHRYQSAAFNHSQGFLHRVLLTLKINW